MKNDFWPKIIYNYADTDNVTHRFRNLQWKDINFPLIYERRKQQLSNLYGICLYGAFIKEIKCKENEKTNETL